MTFAYIGLGGNSADARRHLAHAVRRLKKLPSSRLAAMSPIYVSAPVGCPGQQREYCNCAAKIQTFLPPRRMFIRIGEIERHIQRRRRRRNAPRRLDLDYLSHGAAVLRGLPLTLPHPRMCSRAFVLTPLADVAGKDYHGFKNARVLQTARQKTQAQSLRRIT